MVLQPLKDYKPRRNISENPAYPYKQQLTPRVLSDTARHGRDISLNLSLILILNHLNAVETDQHLSLFSIFPYPLVCL